MLPLCSFKIQTTSVSFVVSNEFGPPPTRRPVVLTVGNLWCLPYSTASNVSFEPSFNVMTCGRRSHQIVATAIPAIKTESTLHKIIFFMAVKILLCSRRRWRRFFRLGGKFHEPAFVQRDGEIEICRATNVSQAEIISRAGRAAA